MKIKDAKLGDVIYVYLDTLGDISVHPAPRKISATVIGIHRTNGWVMLGWNHSQPSLPTSAVVHRTSIEYYLVTNHASYAYERVMLAPATPYCELVSATGELAGARLPSPQDYIGMPGPMVSAPTIGHTCNKCGGAFPDASHDAAYCKFVCTGCKLWSNQYA